MARTLRNKILKNTRLATNYGGWIYCTNCNQNIGYLCYVTYDWLKLNYECNCGSHGSAIIDFQDSLCGRSTYKKLITEKNRFCCADDGTPLITLLDKKLRHYHLEICCKECDKIYRQDFDQPETDHKKDAQSN